MRFRPGYRPVRCGSKCILSFSQILGKEIRWFRELRNGREERERENQRRIQRRLLCKKMSYTTQFLSSLVEIISSYSPRVGRAVVSSNPGVSCRVLLQPMIDGVSLSDKNLNLGHFTSFDKSEGKNRIYKFLAALSIEGLSKCGSVCQLLVEVQHKI